MTTVTNDAAKCGTALSTTGFARRFWASNPRARHADKQRAQLAPRMTALGVEALYGATPEEWRQVLRGAALGRDDLLVVHGGDGTLQVILTALGAGLAVAEWPSIAILPAGGTNMTAYDGGGRQTVAAAMAGLEAMLSQRAPLRWRLRPIVRVEDGATVRYGFFFGAGAIVRCIEFYHREIARGAIGDEFASGLTLLRAGWGIARRDRRFIDAAGARFTVAGKQIDRELLMFFATTVERMFLGIRPFWGDGRGGMHTTWIDADVKHFFWRLPRLLRRGGGLTPAQGYESADLDALQLVLDGPYTIDGELFAAPAAPLQLIAEGPVRLLRCVGDR